MTAPLPSSESADPVRLLIADDHPLVRKGLRGMLSADSAFEIAAEAANGQEAVELATSLQPDVVLMDLHMPGMSGIDANRAILAAAPAIKILMLTLYDDDDSVFSALRAGARGYLLKDSDEAEVVRAIHSVAGGNAIFSAGVASRVLAYFASPPPSASSVFPMLSDREREVLVLLAQGKSNVAIGDVLFVSPKTVANHLSNIFAKLQVASRTEAIIRAREAGLR
jgi:DNA-binding NarL/FixJ family response regulator